MTLPMGPNTFATANRNARSRMGAMGAADAGNPPLEEGKVPMKDANYLDPTPDPARACARCINFEGPDGCEKVAGTIAPTGTCDLFEKMGAPGGGAPPEDLAPPMASTSER